MKKILNVILVGIIALLGIYVAGPTYPLPRFDDMLPVISKTGAHLEQYVTDYEHNYNLKPNNEARILWADSNKRKTPYAILYLHGYGASQEEGAPIHRNTAKKFGMNLYLSRLEGHGIASDSSFKSLTPQNYMASAKRSLAIAKQLGDSVIIMSTSTGCSFGLYLSSISPNVSGLILYSPYIELANSFPNQIIGPWGASIVKNAPDQIISFDRGELQSKYWTKSYHVNGYLALISTIKSMMVSSTFGQVTCPVFMGYYYKNEVEQDPIVSVSAMLNMYETLGTPKAKKVKEAFPEVRDHVIASYIKSKDFVSVGKSTNAFIKDVLNIAPR